jgi:arginine exporter protein ArgO
MAHAIPAGGRGIGDLLRSGTLAQTAALLVGAVFLLVGILGFIPGITTNYGDMRFAGHESEAELFGIFQVSVLHNLVHLAFGVVGFLMARTHGAARLFLVGGGIIYLALWLYGLAVDQEEDANFIPVNEADDWLHFGLGVGMILLGALLWRGERRVSYRGRMD